ncbi:MAG: hypothetical protein GDA55_00305 [Cellvibrionales bacterium]|nr:hypothetical protein [Cellvibrionales bacterium]
MSRISEQLAAIRASLGAPRTEWKPSRGPSKAVTEALRKPEGVVIKPGELETLIGPGSLLSYKGAQCVLYIKDTRQDQFTLENKPEEARKVHLVDCATLKTMKIEGRFQRYVATQRTDGKFLVEPQNKVWGKPKNEIEVRLHPCKNCLKYLNYENCTSWRVNISRVVKEFSFETFFHAYSTFFENMPRYSDITAPLGGYVKNWNKISRNYRQKMHWTCEQCGVDLSEQTNLLHAHHKNGVVTDNSNQNLQALCVLCHSKQPWHDRMPVKPRDRVDIERLRREQGIERAA